MVQLYMVLEYMVMQDSNELNHIINSNNILVHFKVHLTIYESQYKCTFNPNEFTLYSKPIIYFR
jgi:hypothetical protein